jgi:Flp pilus assembly protein TadG
MTAPSRWRRGISVRDAEEGSAIVEFVFLGVLLLVPIVYLIVALGRIQAGALAVEQGAREAGRAFVTAPDETTAVARARAAATLAYQDQGFAAPGRDQVAIVCNASPCLSANGRVTVKSSITVVLPGVPGFLNRLIPVQVTLSAAHVATVNEFSAR